MADTLCRICSSTFYAKPSWIKKGHAVYCSKDCQNRGRKTGKVVKCFLCQKEVYKQANTIADSTSQQYFCTKACSTRWHNAEFKEEKHGNWKHGSFAYRRILERSSMAMACTHCGISEKELLLAHHVDKNRKNNALSNLAWLCHNCHHLVHSYPEEENVFLTKLELCRS